ncbi:hypothetical protein MIND_00572100 [Mycena indigotica]|uniref:Uncharacterized protein n=1 Tax=Mycena indigotica TaxID=2126181 RepID=A0A8H6SQZ3_9AGAR|nr:uncharacterized protein MIND_00572100 [Mycena indigotica]KAF7303435.1 hypothetical protein MIND_00572100 [Mycena indigotica]
MSPPPLPTKSVHEPLAVENGAPLHPARPSGPTQTDYPAYDDDDDEAVPLRRARPVLDDEENALGDTAYARDPRFDPPAPSPWKRAALLLIIVALFYLAFRLKGGRRG